MLGSWLLGWKGRDTGLCTPAAALFLYASDFVAANREAKHLASYADIFSTLPQSGRFQSCQHLALEPWFFLTTVCIHSHCK